MTSLLVKQPHDFGKLASVYGEFEDQTEIARFRILDGPEQDIHVQSNVRFDVAFGNDESGGGRSVVSTLGGIGVRIGEIIQRFTPLV
jgi:hypothetical protein